MTRITPRTRLGNYFHLIEFVPKVLYEKYGDEILRETYRKVSRKLIEYLDALRQFAGRPVIITSGYRPRAYNRLVGGSNGSQHIYGRAADITIPGITYIELIEMVLRFPFTGIGIYNNKIVHVDVRPIRKGYPRALWAGLEIDRGIGKYKYVSFAEGINILASSGYLFRKL